MKILGYNLSKEVKTVQTKLPEKFNAGSIDLKKQVDMPYLREREIQDQYIDYTDKLYPYKLMDYLDKSALHNRIIQSKSSMVSGGQILVDGIPYSDWIKTADFIQSSLLSTFINNAYQNEDLFVTKRRLATDYEISGNYYLEVIWSRDFSRVIGYKYHPWTNLRPGPKNDEGDIEYFVYCQEFYNRKYEEIIIQAFDVNSHQPDGLTEAELEEYPFKHNQIIMVKNDWPTLQYFGRPSYFGGNIDIKTSTFISEYNLSSIQNGFSPSIMMLHEEPDSQEEKMKLGKMIENNFTGIGRKLALFWKRGDQKPEFQPIDVRNLSDQYLALMNSTRESILTAHGVTAPQIFGVETPGKLGSSDLDVAWSIFYNDIISPDKVMLEKTFNDLLKINGFVSIITFETKKPFEASQNNQQQ